MLSTLTAAGTDGHTVRGGTITAAGPSGAHKHHAPTDLGLGFCGPTGSSGPARLWNYGSMQTNICQT